VGLPQLDNLVSIRSSHPVAALCHPCAASPGRTLRSPWAHACSNGPGLDSYAICVIIYAICEIVVQSMHCSQRLVSNSASQRHLRPVALLLTLGDRLDVFGHE
jgi:hypothetical protein